MTKFDLGESLRLSDPELYEYYLIENEINPVGSMVRAVNKRYEFYNNKLVNISKFYNVDEIKKYAILKYNNDYNLDIDYFINNDFILKLEDNDDGSEYNLIFKNENDNIEFYIDYEFGSGGDCECCAGYNIIIL